MLPSDMNVDIKSGTVGYNNKILVSDGNVSLGKMIKLILWSWQRRQSFQKKEIQK